MVKEKFNKVEIEKASKVDALTVTGGILNIPLVVVSKGGKLMGFVPGLEIESIWGEIGEEFTYNASFIKLRELTFGYDFTSLLQNQKVVKGLSLSLVARNLWTIMKHTPNIDPEAAYNNSNGQGLELNGYPATRNVGFNLNIKF